MMTTALTERQIEVMNKMQEIAANVRKRVKETEEIRRIPEATMQELKDSGIMYILRPERYGGLQARICRNCTPRSLLNCRKHVPQLDGLLLYVRFAILW